MTTEDPTVVAEKGRISVQVEVDTDDLRRWAGWHADRGHHGAAHVLYKAAGDGESLADQALREARTAERERIAAALIDAAPSVHFEMRHDGTEDPRASAYVEGWRDAIEAVRHA